MKGLLTLDLLPIARLARVVAVDWTQPAGERLLSLGLLPESEVTILGVAPLGDPIAIRVGNLRLAIRRGDAACVTVAPAEGAEEW